MEATDCGNVAAAAEADDHHASGEAGTSSQSQKELMVTQPPVEFSILLRALLHFERCYIEIVDESNVP